MTANASVRNKEHLSDALMEKRSQYSRLMHQSPPVNELKTVSLLLTSFQTCLSSVEHALYAVLPGQ